MCIYIYAKLTKEYAQAVVKTSYRGTVGKIRTKYNDTHVWKSNSETHFFMCYPNNCKKKKVIARKHIYPGK